MKEAATYHLEMNEADMLEIHHALIKRPFENVAPLINKINQQISMQNKSTSDKEKPMPEIPK